MGFDYADDKKLFFVYFIFWYTADNIWNAVPGQGRGGKCNA